MSGAVDFLLLLVLVADLYVVYTSRVAACIKATAVQGCLLALVPVFRYLEAPAHDLPHVVLMASVTVGLKVVLIPVLLQRAMRKTSVRRDVEPYVSTHLSVLLAAGLIGVAFWMAASVDLPGVGGSTLFVPTAFATFLIGFLVLVSRRKAVTQVVGYLVIENGIFVFGQSVAAQMPFLVELGILLDLLVGVFVMGIVVHQINREFDHIDVDQLNLLRG